MADVTIGYKGCVATKPFAKRGVEMKGNGFVTIAQRMTLEGLEVVFGNGTDINPGDVIHVHPDGAKSWGKDPLDVLGQTVIIAKPDVIVMVTKRPGSRT